jgi:hypothetical protein
LSPAYGYHLFCHFHAQESIRTGDDTPADTDKDLGEVSEVKDLLRVAIKRAYSAGQKELRLMLSLKEKVTH